MSERCELWRQEDIMQQKLILAKEKYTKKEHNLCSVVGKSTLSGRDSVLRVIQAFRERGGRYAEIANGYYDMLIDNFECDETMYTAVEVTSGNRLFCHIVKDDKIGTEILKEMNRQSLPGEVTFVALNRLYVKHVSYPKSKDVMPMIGKLNYESRCERAVKYIFGKILICRDLEVATQVAREPELDCVTLDGDQVSRRGGLTGGYRDPTRSRIRLYKTYMQSLGDISDREAQLSRLREAIARIENDIIRAASEKQKDEDKICKDRNSLDKLRGDINLEKNKLLLLERPELLKERSLSRLTSRLESMELTAQSLLSELQQEMLTQLSDEDRQELETLNDQILTLTQESKEIFSERMSLETEKNELENLLDNRLYHRKEELEADLQEISVKGRKRKLDERNAKLADLDSRIDVLNDKILDVDAKLEEFFVNNVLMKLERKLDRLKAEELKYRVQIKEDAIPAEQMICKLAALRRKIEECQKNIRDLGCLPTNAFEKYRDLSRNELFKKLEECNRKLKRLGGVNKKALDQYTNFSLEKEKLIKRKEELDRGHEALVELTDALEIKKEEAIERTFKQVLKNFTDIFKQLVPRGCANLTMRVDESVIEDRAVAAFSVDHYSGIGISVSFTGQDAEMREMNQLSGGQKSLVALALIFAIQKCNKAPFYLFDEIDQALDANHRKAVADMIHELSRESQFITTTFKPELLEKADKFYGVAFYNSVSHINEVTKDEARDFFRDNAAHM